MKLVIGIGAQKAGTSWLADYFAGHSEVFMSPIKELHFFDEKHLPKMFKGIRARRFQSFKARVAATYAKDYFGSDSVRKRIADIFECLNFNGQTRNYKKFFKDRITTEKIGCEITPSYSMLDRKGFQDMKASADEVKIIFLLRNPIERLWSALRMAEGDGLISIEENFYACLDSDTYNLRSDYFRTFSELTQVFPREQICIEFYENLFSEEAIRRISDFCCISYLEPNFGKEVNKTVNSKVMKNEWRMAAFRKYQHIYTWASMEFKSELPLGWRKDMGEFG